MIKPGFYANPDARALICAYIHSITKLYMYKGRSLTCICCKSLENILASNINRHLAFDSMLTECQHRFRSQRSCETQLVQFVHDIMSKLDGAVNRGHKLIDFSMDFAKIPHRMLSHKILME